MKLYRLLYPLFVGGCALASPFSPKLRRTLTGRRRLQERLEKAAPQWGPTPYWFHVASAGELEQLIPILEAIKTLAPDAKRLITYFSPTAERAVELESERRKGRGEKVPWEFADYSPFDFPKSVQRFLGEVKPKAFAMIHREIWPELVLGCQAAGIPAYLFSAYFPADSSQFLKRYRPYLKTLRGIGTVDEPSALRAKGATDASVRTIGDPRIERVLQRKERSSTAPWAGLFQGQEGHHSREPLAGGLGGLGSVASSFGKGLSNHRGTARTQRSLYVKNRRLVPFSKALGAAMVSLAKEPGSGVRTHRRRRGFSGGAISCQLRGLRGRKFSQAGPQCAGTGGLWGPPLYRATHFKFI